MIRANNTCLLIIELPKICLFGNLIILNLFFFAKRKFFIPAYVSKFKKAFLTTANFVDVYYYCKVF